MERFTLIPKKHRIGLPPDEMTHSSFQRIQNVSSLPRASRTKRIPVLILVRDIIARNDHIARKSEAIPNVQCNLYY